MWAVSYDLAVWEGAQPATDLAAATDFERRYQRDVRAEPVPSPTRRIGQFVQALLARWPDIDGDADTPSLWATAPLMAEATGRLVYLTMVHSRAETALAFIVLTGLNRGCWYAALQRRDGWFVQAGVGVQAGTRAGWYALERQDGDPGRHYRTTVTDLQEIITAFTGFADDDPTWTRRFAWHHHQI